MHYKEDFIVLRWLNLNLLELYLPTISVTSNDSDSSEPEELAKVKQRPVKSLFFSRKMIAVEQNQNEFATSP